ncbi:PREDICTED: uncharacterized protein LOC104802271 isoform X1 [Tarenaya hassleriana]|uniref:uncharacterized protein LOC104802271 isoform X1 n=1 Tax=Tarenaya hassleriana TaxID=28532 RepID=UPI00053C6634|nr:PREDICTED: uncharacterized protein LOC104802271 isoform X1 [Tarenaya hassleriana]
MERPEEEFLRVSDSETMVSVTVGRFMSTLLSTRPRKLQESISRLCPDSHKGSVGSIDEALWFLYKYVRDAAERDESMDEILVPIIEHTLRFKDTKHGSQALILLNWLFQDEVLFQDVARNLSEIIVKKEDRFLALGWCFLVRALVECEGNDDQQLLPGIREKHHMLVKIFSSAVPHLSLILLKGSILQDGFELPTRLSVAAADCLLSITGALAKSNETPAKKPKPPSLPRSSEPVALIPNVTERRKMQTPGPVGLNCEMRCTLWNHLEELICLVQSLLAWNRKNRQLHAKGLNQVLRWLKEIKLHHSGAQDEQDTEIFMNGALLLSSCWKHYSVLLHLEDLKFSKLSQDLLEQYLSGIQYYSESHSQGSSNAKNSGIETQKFFVNCLCLLLGRFEGKKLESITLEYGTRLVPSLLHQLRCNDEGVTDGVVGILKATVFKQHSASGGSSLKTRHMDIMIPSLLHILDERDGTAKAVIVLIAEYCSISTDNHCLNEVLQRLVSGTTVQRMNAMDVISEIIHMSNDPFPSHIPWNKITDCLLKCLGDEETSITLYTVELLKLIEPSLVLPALISIISSADGKVLSQATEVLLGILKHHKEESDVICLLLDCLSSNTQALDTPGTSEHSTEGSKSDNDRVLKLIPEWAKNVQNWNILIGPLLDKMFSEPSNATIVRFLSYTGEHLAKASNAVLLRVLSRLKGQNGSSTKSYSTGEAELIEKSLFDRLCPLLILRLLPQRVFNDLDSSIMYGQFLSGDTTKGLDNQDIKFEDHQCIVAFILKRAFSKFEFEEVRKLSAELCGRVHPQVLFPIVSLLLEEAAGLKDILIIKACLFSICTSLVVRGWESLSHPATPKIRKLLETVLLWPPIGSEISKAQHGCIDCLALMICTELQPVESPKPSGSDGVHTGGKDTSGGDASRDSVLTYVIHHLIQDRSERSSMAELDDEHSNKGESPFPIPFRLCMANVLISVCQKISESAKKKFARKTLPSLIHSLEVICEGEVRAACIQVMFSATYHLKSVLLPYSADLLKLSLRFLEQGSEKEKLAGAKLMASLMASEDAVLESISGGLIEARHLLSKASLSDHCPQVREVCGKLLACITPPL